MNREFIKHLYFKMQKLIIFLSGMLIGCVFTYIAMIVPWDLLTLEKGSNIAVVTPEIDPFENFDIPINDRITAKIRNYLHPGKKMDLVQRYKRSGRYMPMISTIFDDYNLPQFLTFLPLLESGFIPESGSRAGATGLWQLMPATASEYGLKYNRWIDERRDPEKSTIAAAEFLRFLYGEFQNWDLALAAYNCGTSKIKRAMRLERTSNYWDLESLSKETLNFVPRFYAILHILANPKEYDLNLPEMFVPMDYENIELEATFSLEQIAALANVSPKVIKNYNPALIDNIAPSGKYIIRVPVGVKEHFLEQYKINPPEQIEFTYTTYRVRKGDSLYKIAKKFGTTINAIKTENNLGSTRWIRIGQLLRIATVTVVEESQKTTTDNLTVSGDSTQSLKMNQIKFEYTVERDFFSINILAQYYAVTIEDLQAANPWLQTDRLQKGDKVVIYKPANKITMHKTQRGDSLWQLARRYHTTVANLKRWNQLQNSRIHPGQRLIVKLI
ncbi:LysM peptidoglycan-binding domain-containing protein [candidate division KSB1 bacterium]|nr:LysM peptidoglycan-binding domain-containing protein [candidate division KSB1 bacterium]